LKYPRANIFPETDICFGKNGEIFHFHVLAAIAGFLALWLLIVLAQKIRNFYRAMCPKSAPRSEAQFPNRDREPPPVVELCGAVEVEEEVEEKFPLGWFTHSGWNWMETDDVGRYAMLPRKEAERWRRISALPPPEDDRESSSIAPGSSRGLAGLTLIMESDSDDSDNDSDMKVKPARPHELSEVMDDDFRSFMVELEADIERARRAGESP
jgi:hypothetical protein